MAETTQKAQGRRKEVVGEVVANRMQKTIVVQVTRKKAHPFYGRVIARQKKFYAHDEKNEAHVGDVVRIEETRPLSKLKRWKLKDIVRKAALVPEAAVEVPALELRQRSEEHTSELQSHVNLVCRLLLEKKKERSGSYASSACMVDAGFENQKELTKMPLDNQNEIAEMQN